MRFRAVIFDLWQTLVPWPVDSANAMYTRLVETWGADPETFHELWHRRRRERETGPIEPHLRAIADELGLGGDLETVMTIRRDWTFESLVPRAEAIPTLEELRRRGHKLGMISACSEDVRTSGSGRRSQRCSTPRCSRARSASASRTRGSMR